MNTAIVVALITSIASLVAASFSAVWAVRLQRGLATEERKAGAKAELDRHREPLLFAANELGGRIDNIRNREFLSYFDGPNHLREQALLGTLFRFGQYFARLEMLLTDRTLMHYEKDEDTKAVAGIIGKIGRTFASDHLEPSTPFMSTRRFMVWRELQRGIGEMMCEERQGKPISCIGYASFVNNYDNRYSKWFTSITEDLKSFGEDLRSGAVDDSERLHQLQSQLAELVTKLDEEKAYLHLNESGKLERQLWIARADQPSSRARYRAGDEVK